MVFVFKEIEIETRLQIKETLKSTNLTVQLFNGDLTNFHKGL